MKRNNYEVEEKMTYSQMILGVLLLLTLFIIMPSIIGYSETHYTRKDCVVVSVTDDVVVAKDSSDRLWSFYATEDSELKVNDIIDLKMYNNHTDNIIDDDEVVDVK